jgi:hypothetical protein
MILNGTVVPVAYSYSGSLFDFASCLGPVYFQLPRPIYDLRTLDFKYQYTIF